MNFVPCVGNDGGARYTATTRNVVARCSIIDRPSLSLRQAIRPRLRAASPWLPHVTGPVSTRKIRCACTDSPTSPLVVQTATKQQNTTEEINPPTYVSAPGKVIAVGDLHGDLPKTIQSLELAGVVCRDDQGWPKWCGGNATVVQLGDVLDRGDCEIGILMLLRDLHHQAEQTGGAVYMINGNHESLNICGNFRYVTQGAYYECALAAGLTGEVALRFEDLLAARIGLYSPGGIVARELAKNPTVLVVNDTVFAHGGLLPIHVNYGLERINAEMAAWMRGDVTDNGHATPPYIAMGGPNSILWNRTLAQEYFPTPYEKLNACSLVKSVLRKLKAKRLVVGHTPQVTPTPLTLCSNIWRVDVGMSEGVMNAEAQVIIIDKDVDGATVIDVVQSLNHHDKFVEMNCIEQNNIQATTTTMQFESLPVHGCLQPATDQMMGRKLVSRLKAYS